ncbi:piggyBac transposable element-derived protein 4-like [Vespula squamosa]|uniref:PiggyBac transposable element-derived protein 4-like n=1 Tax=Vespula squamosa TaxID=30214 RepID=A0ABD2A165_VESSQ
MQLDAHNCWANLTAINAWILHKECTGSKICRKKFIFCLAEELDGKYKEDICQKSDALFLLPLMLEV